MYLEDESCKQHFTSLLSYGISYYDYPIKKAQCIYVVFWWQNFLVPLHDSSLAAMQMGLPGNSKFTSLHFGISC